MTPQDQLIDHAPDEGRYGDCYRTCIAAVLDLPAAQVPNFFGDAASYADPTIGNQRRDSWLADRGLVMTTFAWSGGAMTLDEVLTVSGHGQPNSPLILCGVSSLGCNHAVVIMGGKIICDPSGNGIVGPLKEGNWELEVVAVGPRWCARTEPPVEPARRIFPDSERYAFLRPADVPSRRIDLSGRSRFVFGHRLARTSGLDNGEAGRLIRDSAGAATDRPLARPSDTLPLDGQ